LANSAIVVLVSVRRAGFAWLQDHLADPYAVILEVNFGAYR
jgi:hypothetical protein